MSSVAVIPARRSATRVPCVLMRGGTSRGPVFLESDLPTERSERDRVLLSAMGSPHALQIDGLGGGNPLTSKVAIVGKSQRAGIDVEYLFAQVSVDREIVDFSPNCGNMLSAVAPFAIEAGLVKARADETVVRIFNRNTNTVIEAVVQTPDGVVEYDGQTSIDGVPGTAAPIKLTFVNAIGSKTGALFPTGLRREVIQGIDASLIDYAMPMVLVSATDVGLRGDETPEELEANSGVLQRLENLRIEAGSRMGLGDVSNQVVPKLAVLSRARSDGTITSRYFMNAKKCHRGHAVTGALCVATASVTPGTIAADLATIDKKSEVKVEHPTGRTKVHLSFDGDGVVSGASLVRTARRIFEGTIIVSH